MSCEDIPSLLDLQNTKKHVDDFGRLMGTGEGDSTNEVTGQVRPTYNKVMKNLGFKPGSGDFTTGFTVMPDERDIAWYDPVSKNWYSYLGVIPVDGYEVLPGTNPVGSSLWKPVTDQTLRSELSSTSGSSLVRLGFDTVEDVLYRQVAGNYQHVIAKSGGYSPGVIISSMHDAYLYNGMYYVLYGDVTLPYTVTSTIPDPLVFKCCGLLNGYPLNDIRNFGAEPYPAYSHNAINLAIKFINPYPWRGSIANTYTNAPIMSGEVFIPQGWWRCGEKIQHNPGVTLRGCAKPRRIYGRKTPSNNLFGSVIFGDATSFKQTYLIDTANYKNDGTRLDLSTTYISGVNVDVDGLYAASEGSLIKDLYVINGSNFFGGVRQHWAMRGGYDGLAISGFANNLSINQIWNQTLNDLWSEESDIPMYVTETTTAVFTGPHTLLGKGPTAPLASTYDGMTTPAASITENGSTLAVGQKLISRCLLVAYCEAAIFESLVTEYSANPILVRDTRELVLNNYHEEANGVINGVLVSPEACVISGWNSSVSTNKHTSLSKIPFMSMGSNSNVVVDDAVQWEGVSAKTAGFTGVSDNKLTLNSEVLPKTIYRGIDVAFMKVKPVIYVSSAGDTARYGNDPLSPTTINAALVHLSLRGIRDAEIVLLDDVIRSVGGTGVFDTLLIRGNSPLISLSHNSASPFYVFANSIVKSSMREFVNVHPSFTLGRVVSIEHKDLILVGSSNTCYQITDIASVDFNSYGGSVNSAVVFNTSTKKLSVRGTATTTGLVAGTLTNNPANTNSQMFL